MSQSVQLGSLTLENIAEFDNESIQAFLLANSVELVGDKINKLAATILFANHGYLNTADTFYVGANSFAVLYSSADPELLAQISDRDIKVHGNITRIDVIRALLNADAGRAQVGPFATTAITTPIATPPGSPRSGGGITTPIASPRSNRDILPRIITPVVPSVRIVTPITTPIASPRSGGTLVVPRTSFPSPILAPDTESPGSSGTVSPFGQPSGSVSLDQLRNRPSTTVSPGQFYPALKIPQPFGATTYPSGQVNLSVIPPQVYSPTPKIQTIPMPNIASRVPGGIAVYPGVNYVYLCGSKVKANAKMAKTIQGVMYAGAERKCFAYPISQKAAVMALRERILAKIAAKKSGLGVISPIGGTLLSPVSSVVSPTPKLQTIPMPNIAPRVPGGIAVYPGVNYVYLCGSKVKANQKMARSVPGAMYAGAERKCFAYPISQKAAVMALRERILAKIAAKKLVSKPKSRLVLQQPSRVATFQQFPGSQLRIPAPISGQTFRPAPQPGPQAVFGTRVAPASIYVPPTILQVPGRQSIQVPAYQAPQLTRVPAYQAPQLTQIPTTQTFARLPTATRPVFSPRRL